MPMMSTSTARTSNTSPTTLNLTCCSLNLVKFTTISSVSLSGEGDIAITRHNGHLELSAITLFRRPLLSVHDVCRNSKEALAAFDISLSLQQLDSSIHQRGDESSLQGINVMSAWSPLGMGWSGGCLLATVVVRPEGTSCISLWDWSGEHKSGGCGSMIQCGLWVVPERVHALEWSMLMRTPAESLNHSSCFAVLAILTGDVGVHVSVLIQPTLACPLGRCNNDSHLFRCEFESSFDLRASIVDSSLSCEISFAPWSYISDDVGGGIYMLAAIGMNDGSVLLFTMRIPGCNGSNEVSCLQFNMCLYLDALIGASIACLRWSHSVTDVLSLAVAGGVRIGVFDIKINNSEEEWTVRNSALIPTDVSVAANVSSLAWSGLDRLLACRVNGSIVEYQWGGRQGGVLSEHYIAPAERASGDGVRTCLNMSATAYGGHVLCNYRVREIASAVRSAERGRRVVIWHPLSIESTQQLLLRLCTTSTQLHSLRDLSDIICAVRNGSLMLLNRNIDGRDGFAECVDRFATEAKDDTSLIRRLQFAMNSMSLDLSVKNTVLKTRTLLLVHSHAKSSLTSWRRWWRTDDGKINKYISVPLLRDVVMATAAVLQLTAVTLAVNVNELLNGVHDDIKVITSSSDIYNPVDDFGIGKCEICGKSLIVDGPLRLRCVLGHVWDCCSTTFLPIGYTHRTLDITEDSAIPPSKLLRHICDICGAKAFVICNVVLDHVLQSACWLHLGNATCNICTGPLRCAHI